MILNPGAPSPPKPRRKQPSWLTPTVWTVSWISLLQDAANDTVGKSWAAKLAPEHQQLQAQARLQGFSGLGILVALIVAVYIALFAPKTALA